jgi:hypothetical protein
MNSKQGLLRIWLLLSLGCWIVGGYYAYDSYNLARGWEAVEQELKEEFYRPNQWDAHGNLKPREEIRNEMINKQRDEVHSQWLEAVEMQETAMQVMFIPLGVLIIYFVVGWVSQDFGKK